MRIVTWNVNSIRARKDRVLRWIEKHQPDVLCLQEVKTTEEQFPRAKLGAVGYNTALCGQKTYNGVAILARGELSEVSTGLSDGVDDTQARLVSGRVGGVRVVNVYVPNGRQVGTAIWDYKLTWMQRLADYLKANADPTDALVLCGDFNVAPDNDDVVDPQAWQDTVLCHADARERLERLFDWGLVDLFRQHNPEGGLYSWWDYRQMAFNNDEGLRIDLILGTEPVAQRCNDAWVDRQERHGTGASDHAPVVIELLRF